LHLYQSKHVDAGVQDFMSNWTLYKSSSIRSRL
jgi:hypothetical protein